MAKDPILPLYYNDICRSTSTWTDEEFGAYMRLLIEQWDKGFLPKDFQRLTRLCTSLDSTWKMLSAKFTETDQGLINATMEDIRRKRLKFKEKQRNNVLHRYQKSTKNIPLEDEYEDEYENSVVKKIKDRPKDLQEVEEYFVSQNIISAKENALTFFNHYQASGWMRGKTKIKDWKACVKTWKFEKQQSGKREMVL